MLNTVIIQPPLVQLNTPYPSGAYLLSFFNSLYKERKIEGKTLWQDLSTELFHRIFCREGIHRIFSESEKRALKLAEDFSRKGDQNSAFQLRRYISQSVQWEEWIDTIVEIVCEGDSFSGRELVHEFVRSAFVPRGNRVESFLENLGRDVLCDDAKILASLSLADLADYISVCYDKNFSLIRYAERIATSAETFDEFLQNLSSPILENFLRPLLEEKIGGKENYTPSQKTAPLTNSSATEEQATEKEDLSPSQKPAGLTPTLFCITVPFPGCFLSALYTAKLIRSCYGKNALIAFGGGYVNTELRDCTESRLFDFCDFLSYDKGYGTYKLLFDYFEKNDFSLSKSFSQIKGEGKSLYKMRYRADLPSTEKTSEISAKSANSASFNTGLSKTVPKEASTSSIISQLDNSPELEEYERKTLRRVIPDFSGIDFRRSPRLADDENPMHRIWNDGAWLKAFMAYGCYWHKCAFCDTSLDYVKDYCSTDISYLFEGLYQQAEKNGVYGIHFVDEACPPVALKNFALKNIELSRNKQKLTFWGNIRFEKSFTRDLADLLSKGGLTAVSAGIEIATGKGLDAVNKGTDIKNIVSAACAFKEAGILVHSYMIFGFWNQSEQDLINSMETLRQLFQAGLIDSAFWHKFSLTKHSTVYREWKEGKHPDLKPVTKKRKFAENDIAFEGEELSQKYAEPLNTSLQFWMRDEKLSKNVETFFPFRMPKPTIPKNFVENLIQEYEDERDSSFSKAPSTREQYIWLGGRAFTVREGKSFHLTWSYMGELLSLPLSQEEAEKAVHLLSETSILSGERLSSQLKQKTFSYLRGKGLCRIQ